MQCSAGTKRAIVTASALNNESSAQAAPTSRFAGDTRVRWRVPLPLHLFEISVEALDGKVVEWMEHVTAEQYRRS